MSADNNNENDDFFDMRKTYESFQKSLIPDDDIHIGSYLEAYKELCKFCTLLGSVFSFVATEINSKSEVMHELRNKSKDDSFETLKRMIEFEKNLLRDKKYVSGCRTFLRLHRGLDFIRTFLRRVAELGPEDGTSQVGSEAYFQTLGTYHSWWIRQGAYLAMNLLPKKKNLVHTICNGKPEDVEEVLPLMLEAADEVYQRTQVCYKTHDLLDLP